MRAGQRDVVFIAHELTDDTRRALIDGTIDVIINQDAGHEVRSAIRVLMSKADKRPLVEQMERIRIDIYRSRQHSVRGTRTCISDLISEHHR